MAVRKPKRNQKAYTRLACVAADSFPFSGRAEIEQANEKQASEGARLGCYFVTLPQFSSRSRAFGKGKETVATQANTRLGFVPKQKELNNTNMEQDNSVSCDTRVESKTKGIKEERRGENNTSNDFF